MKIEDLYVGLEDVMDELGLDNRMENTSKENESIQFLKDEFFSKRGYVLVEGNIKKDNDKAVSNELSNNDGNISSIQDISNAIHPVKLCNKIRSIPTKDDWIDINKTCYEDLNLYIRNRCHINEISSRKEFEDLTLNIRSIFNVAVECYDKSIYVLLHRNLYFIIEKSIMGTNLDLGCFSLI